MLNNHICVTDKILALQGIFKKESVRFMTTITFTNPQTFNYKAEKDFTFVPYKENFVYTVKAGDTIQLTATTVGQSFYYYKQGLAIGDAVAPTVTITLPAKITLTNTGDKPVAFVPYKENFTQEIAVGDKFIIPATTVGQVLYYLLQAGEGLSVVQEAVANADSAESKSKKD